MLRYLFNISVKDMIFILYALFSIENYYSGGGHCVVYPSHSSIADQAIDPIYHLLP